MKNEQGFTLIELLLVMILIGTIISISFTVYTFGNKAFRVSKQRSILQTQVTNVARFITNELRNASENGLDILESPLLELEDDFQYIFLKDNIIYHHNEKTRAVTSRVIENIFFEVVEHDKVFILAFEIDGFDGKNSFTIQSQVLLNNVSKFNLTEGKTGIKYQKVHW